MYYRTYLSVGGTFFASLHLRIEVPSRPWQGLFSSVTHDARFLLTTGAFPTGPPLYAKKRSHPHPGSAFIHPDPSALS